VFFRNYLTCAFLATSLIACGGGGGQSSSSAAPSNSPGMMATSGAMTRQIESRPQAGVPADLNCGSAQPVWTNPRSHTYFEPSAPFYGRTKNGQYMCLADAVKAGYHKAGRRHHHSGMEGGTPAPAST